MLAAWQKVGQEVVSHEARYALFSSVFLYSSSLRRTENLISLMFTDEISMIKTL